MTLQIVVINRNSKREPTCENRNRQGQQCGQPAGHRWSCSNGTKALSHTFDQEPQLKLLAQAS